MGITVSGSKIRNGGKIENTKRKKPKWKFYKPILLVTAFLGGILGIFLTSFYEEVSGHLWNPLKIGVIFALFYFVLGIGVHIVSRINGSWDENRDRSKGKLLALALTGGTLLMLLLGTVFEFLYELGGTIDIHEPDSYIFLIDDSGSMEANDGNFQRYDAIEEVLKGQSENFPYMIYQFTSSVQIARPYGPISSGMGEIVKSNGGGTALQESMESLLGDFKNGAWGDSLYPRIIILTDGNASSSRILKILRDCVDNNIVVGTIGLGSGSDSKLLKRIAAKTGGVFVPVERASELGEAMKTASMEQADRDLFSQRNYVKYEGLYCFLRILFLSALGVFIGGIMYILIGYSGQFALILFFAAVTGVVSAVLMEAGIESTWMGDKIVYFLYFVLLGLTPSEAPYYERNIGVKNGSLDNSRKKNGPVRQSQTELSSDKIVKEDAKEKEGGIHKIHGRKR